MSNPQKQEWNRAGFKLLAVDMPHAARLCFETSRVFDSKISTERHALGCGCESCTGVPGGIDFLLWQR